MKLWVCTTEEFVQLSETISGKLICAGEMGSSQINPGFNCTGQMAHCLYGAVWVSGLLMSTLCTERPMVALGLWNGQA
jgi:hypothetical protein